MSLRLRRATTFRMLGLAMLLASALSHAQDITIAVTGDAIGPYEPITPRHDARFEQVMAILKGADAAFANQEGSVFDIAGFSGSVGAEDGGGHPLATLSVARDFKLMGLSVMSKANNHAVDFGLEGLRASEQSLDAAGIVHAGSGDSETAARAPAYLATSKGRVALVAAASTYPETARAGPPVEMDGVTLRARPGVNTLRTHQTILVTPAEMDALRKMAVRRTDRPEKTPSSAARMTRDLQVWDLHSGQQFYRVGNPPGLHYETDPEDLSGILDSVRTARQHADVAVLSLHAHETASGAPEDPTPADFLPSLFHQAVDAGADIVVRHGPHTLCGIEIYQGRPIFYGMASLFMSIGDVDRAFRGHHLPAAYDDSMIAVVEYHDHHLVRIKLYPITIIREATSLLGAPQRAAAADAQRILRTLQRESAVFGTRIRVEDGVGIIDGS
jgi:poly-gamma-glutamate capsule biosynthesis protein CapA/YwtB (metallophosphatase superfamily)